MESVHISLQLENLTELFLDGSQMTVVNNIADGDGRDCKAIAIDTILQAAQTNSQTINPNA
jgi:hypothetical protein